MRKLIFITVTLTACSSLPSQKSARVYAFPPSIERLPASAFPNDECAKDLFDPSKHFVDARIKIEKKGIATSAIRILSTTLSSKNLAENDGMSEQQISLLLSTLLHEKDYGVGTSQRVLTETTPFEDKYISHDFVQTSEDTAYEHRKCRFWFDADNHDLPIELEKSSIDHTVVTVKDKLPWDQVEFLRWNEFTFAKLSTRKTESGHTEWELRTYTLMVDGRSLASEPIKTD